MEVTLIDWEQNYKLMVELEKSHRLTIESKDTLIEALKIQIKCLTMAENERVESIETKNKMWADYLDTENTKKNV